MLAGNAHCRCALRRFLSVPVAPDRADGERPDQRYAQRCTRHRFPLPSRHAFICLRPFARVPTAHGSIQMFFPLLLLLGAYLAGSVPFGYLVCRARGMDVRQVGSGNIGATNVARVAGKLYGILVLLLDLAKGFGPVSLALLSLSTHPQHDLWIAAVMLAAVLGHVFSLFLRFRGGKGVATALGVTLAVCPVGGTAGLLLYVLLYLATRISSVGSLAGALGATIVVWVRGAPRPIGVAVAAITLLIVLRHHANLRRLLRGEERRV